MSLTKAEFLRAVRRDFEDLPGHLQEKVALRSLRAPIIVWCNLTSVQLEKVCGATVAVRLLWEDEL